jgi:hypothetical protein
LGGQTRKNGIKVMTTRTCQGATNKKHERIIAFDVRDRNRFADWLHHDGARHRMGSQSSDGPASGGASVPAVDHRPFSTDTKGAMTTPHKTFFEPLRATLIWRNG